MKNRIKFSKAINNALKFSLKKDKNLIVYGLGVTDPKEIFDTTKNLKKNLVVIEYLIFQILKMLSLE